MKGFIYKLHDNTTGNDYYGSTIKTLKKRLNEHKVLDCSSKSIIQNNNYIMILLETIEFENKKQLLEREKYYIQNYPCINKILPVITEEERKEQKKKYHDEHYEENKDKRKEQKKEYYKLNKDKINERVAEYREANKEKIKERTKKYREANKDKIKENRKEKITCECGSIFCKDNLSKHKKTKSHLNYVNSINEIN